MESTRNRRCKNDDSSWAGKYSIQIYGLIARWKVKGDNREEIQYNRQVVQCTFEWQRGEDGWQRDHVWIQEYSTGLTNPREILYLWQSRMIGQLQLVFIVRNEGMVGKLGCTQISKYTGALIKLLQWRQHEFVNLIHGMIEVKLWQTSVAKNQRFFTRERIFSLANIIRRAYVIPATAMPVQYLFVSNYVDWNQFNTLHDKNFKAKTTRAADKVAAQFK